MGTRVYIGRLSHHARERDVERFFKGYGRLRDVMLKNGYGFVVSWSVKMRFCWSVTFMEEKNKISQLFFFFFFYIEITVSEQFINSIELIKMRVFDCMFKNMSLFLQEFEDYRDADDAVYELNGKDLAGER